jgi:hypothetical protein
VSAVTNTNKQRTSKIIAFSHFCKTLLFSITDNDLEQRYEDVDEAEILARLEERYAAPAASADRRQEYDSFVDNDISENQLLPDVHDPNLWIVKCVIGTERY